MRKKCLKTTLLKLWLTCLLFSGICGLFPLTIHAANDFVVYDISTTGTWTQISAHDTFDAASTVMQQYQNGVITHANSKSPTKIIAMTRGVAVSYPFRSGTINDGNTTVNVTMTINQYATKTTNEKTTYIAAHYEMLYKGTVSYDAGSGNGRIHVLLAGFDGYANLSETDLIPYVYFENNLPIQLGGSTFNPDYEDVFTLSTPRQTEFVISSGEIVFKRWSYYNGVSKNNTTIGPKADWMEEGKTYYSFDFVHYYTDRGCTALARTFYNYYQYLPLRSKSNLSASDLDSYLVSRNKPDSVLTNQGSTFVSAQDSYGTNALLVYAIACQESGFGTSNIALRTNNLFGINAIDSAPSQATQFASIGDCVNDMTGWFLRRYMEIRDYRFFGTHLGSKGSGFNVKYASDPYWGIQIASIAYHIDKAAGMKDYQYYTVGILATDTGSGYQDSYNIEAKATASASSATVYSTAYGATYQKDFTLILNRQENGYYEVPATNPLVNHALTAENSNREVYNFLDSVVYLDASKISVLSNSRYASIASPSTLMLYPEHITSGDVLSLSQFTFDATGLSLSGYAFNKGIAVRNATDITHSLVLINTADNTETLLSLPADHIDTTIDALYPIRDLSFAFSTFVASNLDLSTLANGEYRLVLRTAYTKYVYTFDSSLSVAMLPEALNGISFSQRENDVYLTVDKNVRLESNVTTSLRTIEWGSDEYEGLLHIKGVAVIRGLPHTDKTKISKELIVWNVDTNEEYIYPLTTYSNEELGMHAFNILDEVNYYYGWYENYIDISTLPCGDYRATLRVELKSADGNTTYYGEKQLMNSLLGYIPSVKIFADTNKTIVIDKNGKYLSRYEISVTKGLASELTSVHKPTQRRTNFSLNSFSIIDGTMSLNGFMYMFGIDHDLEQTPSYVVHFVQDGASVLDVDLVAYEGLYNISSIIDAENDYSLAWFKGENIDLSSLENGIYDIYISENCGEYNDYFQLYDRNNKFASQCDYENKKYVITIKPNNYGKIQIEISSITTQVE